MCPWSGSAIAGFLGGVRRLWYPEEQPQESMTPCQPRQAGELYWSGPQADEDVGILLGPCPLVHALRALAWPSFTSCEETM